MKVGKEDKQMRTCHDYYSSPLSRCTSIDRLRYSDVGVWQISASWEEVKYLYLDLSLLVRSKSFEINVVYWWRCKRLHNDNNWHLPKHSIVICPNLLKSLGCIQWDLNLRSVLETVAHRLIIAPLQSTSTDLAIDTKHGINENKVFLTAYWNNESTYFPLSI